MKLDGVSSRKAALSSGDKTYLGRPCPYGHSGLRYASQGTCCDCAKTRSASDEKKAYDRVYAAKNQARLQAQQQRYAAKNSARIAATAALWAERNPERRRSISKTYKARRRAQEVGGDTTAVIHAWEVAAREGLLLVRM